MIASIRHKVSHRLLFFILMIAGWACQREEITTTEGSADKGINKIRASALVINPGDLTNAFRAGQQVRFDIIGTVPEIDKGDHLFYPIDWGIYGTVLQYIQDGSSLTVDLAPAALMEVWSDVLIQDTARPDLFNARTRWEEDDWSGDTLNLSQTYLYNDLWNGNLLQVLVHSGQIHSGLSLIHRMAGSDTDPWLKRYLLTAAIHSYLDLTVEVKTSSGLQASDSTLVEQILYGPYYAGTLPVYYRVSAWLGFTVNSPSDTTLKLSFNARDIRQASINFNHWSDWENRHTVTYSSVNVEGYAVTKFAGCQLDVFLSRIVEPLYAGECGIGLADRFVARVGSEVSLPAWTAFADFSASLHPSRNGEALGTLGGNFGQNQPITFHHQSTSGTLPNQPPKAAFTVDPESGFTDTSFEFDASASSDLETEASLLEVRWDYDADGHFDTEYSTSKTLLHVYPKQGTYQVILEVRDEGGLTASESQTVLVTLSSSAPVASFTVTPETGRTSDYYLFDAYGCYDAQDDISLLKIRWDFDGDDFWDTGFTTTKTAVSFYTQPGQYIAKLEVLDTQGLTGSTTHKITVLPVNLKPTAVYSVMPATGSVDTVFRFDASASSDPEDASELLRVRWDWEADGTYDTDYSTVKTAQHRFTIAGTYRTVLEVTDTEDLYTTYFQDLVVKALNTPPDADFLINPTSGDTTTLFTFDASLCIDKEDAVEVLEVRWDWDNDNRYDTDFTTEKIFKRTFAIPGTYIIKVMVRDSEGLTDTKARLLEIE